MEQVDLGQHRAIWYRPSAQAVAANLKVEPQTGRATRESTKSVTGVFEK